ncbi:hypothetical protein C7Y66_05265 [Chroococcidiopsis sp. CCALA 051]|uniref:hypothetical protein n=1 Tax=Chroococcidiopsis sp. CCALA 051 TaxID=869949 RepID=UPI000D0CC1DB|nr:hypothetical protein [Chroococcidiopsis sp. CCALA 051]MBE9014902.1 hypothetical protein [Chroococcidiopsidales cyanobacterium LEGE 13417]PSM50182.1 hypothetical protein C7Y66_05265 [Chroococcidiopsis sp. CCALA 051]
MREHTNDWQLDNSKETGKRSLVQKYLQNPFSVTWSKLADLLYPEISLGESAEEVQPDNSSQSQESNSICDRNLYPRFTDRVDPSLYYTVFFPHQRY